MSALTDRLLHVFHWPVAHPIRLLLPGMIVASLLIHGLAAYLFRSGVTPSPAFPPWPSKLVIFPEESASDMILLAARDPSWLSPGRYRERMLPSPHPERAVRALQPSLPPLLAAPRPDFSNEWVPSLPPLAVRALFEPAAQQVPPPSFVAAGARFESGVDGVTDDVLSRLRAVAPDRPPGRATELLLVLAPTGDVRHAWLLHGSGDASLDLAAQRAVQRARFAPAEGGRRDVLRIFWGPRGSNLP